MTDAEYLERFNREFWRTLQGPGVASLSRLQRDALCVMNFQIEINNGGMHQSEDRGLSLADLFDAHVLSQKGKGGG